MVGAWAWRVVVDLGWRVAALDGECGAIEVGCGPAGEFIGWGEAGGEIWWLYRLKG